MLFATPKTTSRQTLPALHRVREALIRDRTGTTNQIHGVLLEFGTSLPIKLTVIKRLPTTLAQHALPLRSVAVLEPLHAHYQYIDAQVS
jgi:transposase